MVMKRPACKYERALLVAVSALKVYAFVEGPGLARKSIVRINRILGKTTKPKP